MRNKIYCPNKRCSALLDVAHVKDNENAVIVCHQCLHVACVQCRVPWHNGYACHEYNVLPPDVRNNEDEEVFRMARQYQWARCINCRTLVELYEGSNHITCQCGTQFCYQCNGPWNELTRQCTRHQCSLWSKEMLELEEQRRNTNTANTQPPDDNLSMFSNQRRLSLSSTTSSNWFIHTSYHRGLPELNPPKNTTEPVASTSTFTTSTATTAAADILPITPPSVINATTSASNSSSTPPSEPVTYQCPKCFKKFLSEHALGVHTRTTRDHDNFEPNVRHKPIISPLI
ncbi:hypothetical protein BDF22DRAFT_16144 [Syncephalis plumigaleata]|nr:hypothetical protein BDF22DRAFT_16144 [Syncephalis plumigaleata]